MPGALAVLYNPVRLVGSHHDLDGVDLPLFLFDRCAGVAALVRNRRPKSTTRRLFAVNRYVNSSGLAFIDGFFCYGCLVEVFASHHSNLWYCLTQDDRIFLYF